VPVRVLIVDDFEPFRKMLRFVLDLEGDVEVVGEVSSAQGGVRAAATLHPDVVVLDCVLPDIVGPDAVRRVHDAEPHARILACSAIEQFDGGEALLASGADEFLDKSTAIHEWVEAIHRHS